MINIKSDYDNTLAKEFRLYYPISPKFALLIDGKETFDNPISTQEVLFYNDKIKQARETLIIGSQKNAIENA